MTDDQEFLIHKQPWVLFRAAGNLLALPISMVEQMVPKGKIVALPGAGASYRGLMKHRDATVPVMDLAGMLAEVEGMPDSGGNAPAGAHMAESRVGQTVIILIWGKVRMGLVVDALVGVEPLPKRSHGIMQVAPGLKGANTPVNGFALRGDSSDMVLLVDVEWLASNGHTAVAQEGAA